MQFQLLLTALAASTVSTAASFAPCKDGIVTINDGEDNAVKVHCHHQIRIGDIEGTGSNYPQYTNFTSCAQACSEQTQGLCCAAQFTVEDKTCTLVAQGDSEACVPQNFEGKKVPGVHFAVVKFGKSG